MRRNLQMEAGIGRTWHSFRESPAGSRNNRPRGAAAATRIQSNERRTSMPGRRRRPSPSACAASSRTRSTWSYSRRRRSPFTCAIARRTRRRLTAGGSAARADARSSIPPARGKQNARRTDRRCKTRHQRSSSCARVAKLRERFADPRVPVAGELRQERGANAVAGEAGIEVARILAPGDAAAAQELDHFAAGDVDERPDVGGPAAVTLRHRINPREAAQAGAA